MRRIAREFIRLTPLVGLAAIVLIPDPARMEAVLQMLGIVLLVAATSHLVRKILFPYLDLELYVRKALEDSKAAGMVFLGVSWLLGVMIFSATRLLK